MPIDVSLNDAVAKEWSGPFYAIRIGTGASNDIVISGAAEGVHEHHCTLIHTGSSYRIEMLPTHLVFIDGELAECGQQLFLEDVRKCVLSIGGAPPARGTVAFDPPPQVTCVRKGEAVEHAVVKVGGKPIFNRDRVRENRKKIVGLVWAVLIGGPLLAFFLGANWLQDRQDRSTIREFESFAAQTIDRADVVGALPSVVQLGLARGDGEFFPVGTGWIWASIDGPKLVTNIHVIEQLSGEGAPSLRLYSGDATQVVALEDGTSHHRKHPSFAAFKTALAKRGPQLGVPNVYDVAVLPLPELVGIDLNAIGLKLSNQPAQAGTSVMMLGFPLEGDAQIAQLSELATVRAGRIGRVSDPFGIPAASDGAQGDYLIITGAPAQGGESGSPIIDGEGRVIGMTFASFFSASVEDGVQRRTQSGTVKLKALNAQILRDFLSTSPEKMAQQAERWEKGLSYLNLDAEKVLLAQREEDTCQGRGHGKAVKIDRLSRTVETHLSDAKIYQRQGQTYALADEIKFTDDDFSEAEDSSFLVIATSIVTPKGLVTMKAKHPLTRQNIATNDLVSSLVSVNFNLIAPRKASEGKLVYALYSDREGPVKLEVYRIICSGGN